MYYYYYSNQNTKDNIFVVAWWSNRWLSSFIFHIFLNVFLTFVNKIIYSEITNIEIVILFYLTFYRESL